MSAGLPFLTSYRRRSVLSRAVARWRAGNYSAALDALVDESGNGLHARLGSSVGADSNDPLRLTYGGEKYAYLPGSSGNYISTPDSVATSITGDIDLRVRLAFDDWTPASATSFLSKYGGGAGSRSYRFQLETDGKLSLLWSADGTAINQRSSSASVGAADGSTKFVRVTLDVDDGAGNHVIKFWTSDDGASWTQLGTTTTVAGTTSIYDSTQALELGAYTGGDHYVAGKIYTAEIRNGIDGTVVARFDAGASAEPYATLVSSTGETWTLNRSTSGRKLAVVDRDLLLLGSDDYLEVADHPLLNFGATHSMTLVFASRSYGTPAARRIFFSKRTDTGSAAGYIMYFDISNRTLIARVGDGTNNVSQPCGSASVAGQVELLGMIVNRENSTISAVTLPTISAASISPVGSMVSAAALAFGAVTGGATNPLDGEFIAGALFREALSAADLRRLAVEMGLPS